MASEEGGTTAIGYIQHHLQNMAYGKLPAGYVREKYDGTQTVLEESTWTMAQTSQEAIDMGFHAIHFDTLGWSIGLGLIFCFIFRLAAKRASTDVPRGLQSFVELVVSFVDKTVSDMFHHSSKIVAPLGLTIFVWIFLMNLMDLIPVDWFPVAAAKIAGNDHLFFWAIFHILVIVLQAFVFMVLTIVYMAMAHDTHDEH